MVLDHEIFRKPYSVTPTLVEEPHNRDAERTVRNWTVYRGREKYEIGLVSNRDKLSGAPDTEIISGGVNSKGDRGVALAREANLFQWGFTGPPSAMTDEAKKVFVNAVCYIAQFDGHSVHADAGTLLERVAPDAPTPFDLVTATAAILAPGAKAGDTVTLAVKVRVADGWHIYGKVPDGSTYPPTVLELEEAKGIEPAGDWKRPAGHRDGEGNELLEGEFVFTRELRVTEDARYIVQLAGELRYQVCNEEICRPPGVIEISASLPIRR